MGWFVTALRALGFVVGAFASVAAGLQAAGVWHLKGGTLVALVVGAAGVTLVGQIVSVIKDVRKRRRETLAQDVRNYLFAMFIKVLGDARVPAAALGFAAYEVRRRWIWQWPTYRRGAGWRWRWPRPWRKVLWRLDRHRAPDRLDTSRTVWIPGKGIIGLCVKTGDYTYADVKATWAPFANTTEADWAAAHEGIRMGFTFEEFQRRRGKAGVVYAMPVLRDTKTGERWSSAAWPSTRRRALLTSSRSRRPGRSAI